MKRGRGGLKQKQRGSLAISIAIHLLIVGTYYTGRKFGLWEKLQAPAWMKTTRMLTEMLKKQDRAARRAGLWRATHSCQCMLELLGMQSVRNVMSRSAGVVHGVLLRVGCVSGCPTSVRNWARSIFSCAALVVPATPQRKSDAPSPGRRIWDRLSNPLKAQLEKIEEDSPGDISADVVADLLDEFNNLLNDPAFYDQAAWQETEPGTEAD